MSHEIRYHAAVQGELLDILDHYGRISSELADDFWTDLNEAIEYARCYPTRHHFDASGRRRCNLKRFPYHFLFRTSPAIVKVTVIRHNSRSPGYGSRRN